MTSQKEMRKITVDTITFEGILNGHQRLLFVPFTSDWKEVRKNDRLEICLQSAANASMTAIVKEIVWEVGLFELIAHCAKKSWLDLNQPIDQQYKKLKAQLDPDHTENSGGFYALQVQVTTYYEPPSAWSSETHGWSVLFVDLDYENAFLQLQVALSAMAKDQQDKIQIDGSPHSNSAVISGEENACRELIAAVARQEIGTINQNDWL